LTLIITGLFLFFASAFLFIYSLILLKPFSKRRKLLLRLAYFLSFLALVLVLYGRGFITILTVISFLLLFISYLMWEITSYFLKR